MSILHRVRNYFSLKRSAHHWNTHQKSELSRGDWWQHPAIVQHYNEKVCGKALNGVSAGPRTALKRLCKGQALKRGVSVGCGNGRKEIALVKAGMVQSMELFEISAERIEQGRARALENGLSEQQVRFHLADAFEAKVPSDTYDLAFWDNSLHHMFDVERAIRWSHRVLKPSGIFYMNDFVGPSRFQWSSDMIDVATKVRRSLPADKLHNRRKPTQPHPLVPHCPTLAYMMNLDPSEAADSDRIVRVVEETFPETRVILLGGVVYHLALSGILDNFQDDDAADQALLKQCLVTDDECTQRGLSHYGFCLARKTSVTSRV